MTKGKSSFIGIEFEYTIFNDFVYNRHIATMLPKIPEQISYLA